jgi:hypothetical protein
MMGGGNQADLAQQAMGSLGQDSGMSLGQGYNPGMMGGGNQADLAQQAMGSLGQDSGMSLGQGFSGMMGGGNQADLAQQAMGSLGQGQGMSLGQSYNNAGTSFDSGMMGGGDLNGLFASPQAAANIQRQMPELPVHMLPRMYGGGKISVAGNPTASPVRGRNNIWPRGTR